MKSKLLCGLLLPLSLLLNSCVDLSGANYRTKNEGYKQRIAQGNPYYGAVYTMLGGLGLFSTGMKDLRDAVIATYHIPAQSDMWYNAGAVSRQITNAYYRHCKYRPIILVGHSLGANDQIKVARNLEREGISVDLLVTVDAVSQTRIPANVKHVMNFYKSGYVPMFSGLKVRAVNPQKTRVENIDVTKLEGVKVNHFTIDKDPVVQAMIMKEIKKVISHGKKARA